TLVGATEFAPWRDAAHRHGFGACIVAASCTRDDGQLVLASYSRQGGPALGEELLDWAQRLVDELSRFWDHQILLERSIRMSRYRDAQRTIQKRSTRPWRAPWRRSPAPLRSTCSPPTVPMACCAGWPWSARSLR